MDDANTKELSTFRLIRSARTNLSACLGVMRMLRGPKRYEGWQETSLAFFLHGVSIERL